MSYKITHATMQDLPEIMVMAEAFINHVNSRIAKWNPELMSYRIKSLINDGFFAIIRDSSGTLAGGMGAVILPSFWSGELCGEEVFWWVSPEFHRTRAGSLLLNYFMSNMKDAGLEPVLHLLHDSPISPKSLKRHYGLIPKEITFYLE